MRYRSLRGYSGWQVKMFDNDFGQVVDRTIAAIFRWVMRLGSAWLDLKALDQHATIMHICEVHAAGAQRCFF